MKVGQPSSARRSSTEMGAMLLLGMMRPFRCFLQALVWRYSRPHPTSLRFSTSRHPHCSLPALLSLNLYFRYGRYSLGSENSQLIGDATVADWSLLQSVCKGPHDHETPGVRVHRGASPRGPPAGTTFEQVHGAQLEGDAVLLGEDVDGAAGLGQQVQVELQDHGGGRVRGQGGSGAWGWDEEKGWGLKRSASEPAAA